MTQGQQFYINISVLLGNALEFKDDDFLRLVLDLTSQAIFDLLKIPAINSIQAKVGDALKRRSIKRTVAPVPLQPMMPTTGATPLFTTSSAAPLVSLSVKEHKSSLNPTLKEWWAKNRSKWNLQNEELTEGVDYKLVVSLPPDSASLVCGCGTVIILHLHRAHYQLSGYHKHLLTKRCNVINKKLDGSASDDDSATTGKRNGKRPAPPPALATRSKRHRTTNSVN